jgi:hypothetical protein
LQVRAIPVSRIATAEKKTVARSIFETIRETAVYAAMFVSVERVKTERAFRWVVMAVRRAARVYRAALRVAWIRAWTHAIVVAAE